MHWFKQVTQCACGSRHTLFVGSSDRSSGTSVHDSAPLDGRPMDDALGDPLDFSITLSHSEGDVSAERAAWRRAPFECMQFADCDRSPCL